MKTLGAVLAGGQSRRFGSDKAVAMLDGQTLLDHALAALRPHCDAVVVVGRGKIADWPRADMGPLGGIAAALIHAVDQGFNQVLTVSVDCVRLPPDVRERLLALGDQRISKDGVVVIKAQAHRSLEKNRDDAMRRLEELVNSVARPPKTRRPTRPTRGSVIRRLDEKTHRARVKTTRRSQDD